MASKKDLDDAVAKFIGQINGAQPPGRYSFQVGDIPRNCRPRDMPNTSGWSEWSHGAGVYYFMSGKEVAYVGRALPSVTLGTRVRANIKAVGSPAWDAVILDDTNEVGVLVFPGDDWYWLLALEGYLIQELRPSSNKRMV